MLQIQLIKPVFSSQDCDIPSCFIFVNIKAGLGYAIVSIAIQANKMQRRSHTSGLDHLGKSQSKLSGRCPTAPYIYRQYRNFNRNETILSRFFAIKSLYDCYHLAWFSTIRLGFFRMWSDNVEVNYMGMQPKILQNKQNFSTNHFCIILISDL